MKKILFIGSILCCSYSLFSQVIPTNEWVSFWSDSCKINHDFIPVGSVIRAFDPQGVLCGQFTSTSLGSYGLMAVYRDDGATSADEGAQPGDTIHFTINNKPAVIVGPAAIWTASGDVKKVNLTVEQPAIIVTPSTGAFGVVPLGSFAERSFSIKNWGLKQLRIDSMVMNYKFPQDFLVSITSTIIQPADSVVLTIRFQPSIGSRAVNAALSLYSNSSDSNRYQLNLSGSIQTDILPTSEWVSFWSDSSSFDSQTLNIGDVVDIFDPQGTHCGTFTVASSGYYGLVPVYRDDGMTPSVDEGAQPGDTLSFTVNGYKATPRGSGQTVWTSNGAVSKLNLVGKSFPSVARILPSTVNRLQSMNVVLTGAGFVKGLTSVSFGPGISVASFTINSPTQLTVDISVSALASTGTCAVLVSNDGFGTKTDTLKSGFAIYNPVPSLSRLSSSAGNRWQTLNVTFTGANFISGATSVNVATGITVNSVSVSNPTTLIANITISGSAPIGSQNFSVTNSAPGGGTSGSQPFDVVRQIPSTITILSGNNQVARLDSQLVNPLVVIVKDSAANVIESVGVRFVITSFPAGAATQLLSDSVVTTDSVGKASDRLRLGNKTGSYGVTATVIASPITSIMFSATSPAARLNLSVRTLSFGDLGINDSLDITLKITNGSMNPLIIDSIYTKTASFKSLVTKATVTTDTLKLVVKFFPKRFGLFVDSLYLMNNSDTALIKVSLSGNSPFSTIIVTPLTVSFGTVKRDSTKQMFIKITNNSISSLQVDSLYTNIRYFHVAGGLANRIIKKGDTVAVSIQFQPDSIRQYTDTLYIANNSQISLLKLPLLGVGSLTGITKLSDEIPESFTLYQNFPNPFNPATIIRYAIPSESRVKLEIFNAIGQWVVTLVDEQRNAGNYEVEWKVAVTSGLYFYRLEAIATGDPNKRFVETRKMLLLK